MLPFSELFQKTLIRSNFMDNPLSMDLVGWIVYIIISIHNKSFIYITGKLTTYLVPIYLPLCKKNINSFNQSHIHLRLGDSSRFFPPFYMQLRARELVRGITSFAFNLNT